MSTLTPIIGRHYEVILIEKELRSGEYTLEWNIADFEGYNWHDYFDAEGRYLGPDEKGVEPRFVKNE